MPSGISGSCVTMRVSACATGSGRMLGATQSWGDLHSGDALHVTHPAGGTQNFTVYGEVPAQPLSGTGEFIDDVIITLTY